jgi:SAM-dependent methyltransferase
MGLELKDLGNEYAMWDAVQQISLERHVTSYLEVGTRYGDSLLRVLAGIGHAKAPHRLDRIVISDIWHESYFGANNNGTMFDRSHKHIARMLEGMGYEERQITFLDGDSNVTVPTLDKREPFELVLVDGDHNCDKKDAADQDLANCWPLVAPGGYLVFDDISADQKMAELFHHFMKAQKDVAATYIRMNKKFGVAVAEKESHFLETSKIREIVLPYLEGKGIDIGCSRDPITRYCVAFDKSDWPEVTVQGDAAALPFEDESFDWVYSSHCLEDFEDTEAILREWLRVLKHSGTIALYVPHPDLYPGGNPDHKHPGFRPDELGMMLEKLGCKVGLSRSGGDTEPNLYNKTLGLPQIGPDYSTLVIARKL